MYSKEESKILMGLGMPTIFLRFSKALVMLVFFYYALDFTKNEFLIGIAFGITALIQAGLTIPFGFWSDKYGRKKMIIVGLSFFIIGSIFAAHPFGNIYILIFARFLQGISAIYSCILAFIGDTIPTNKRNRTLGIFSIFTGIVFSIGIIIGPTIAPKFLPYSFLFILSAILGLVALLYLILFIKEPKKHLRTNMRESDRIILKDAFFNRNLIIIYSVTFLSNFVLVSILFLLVPLMLNKYIEKDLVGLLLIPIFIIGMIIMMYALKFADLGKRKVISLNALIFVMFGLILFLFNNFLILIIGLVLFFSGMAILDPLLPSYTIDLANKKSKGTASGSYNLTRYLGEGTGPIIAGLLLFMLNNIMLLILLIIIILICILLTSTLGCSVKKIEL